MENSKRPLETVDPDYIFTENKKMKLSSSDKDNSRIMSIIRKEFQTETDYKEKELEEIEDRLKIAMKTLQLLRSVVITSYYNQENLILNTQNIDVNSQTLDPNVNVVVDSQSKVHPAIKKCLGKAPMKCELPSRSRLKELSSCIDLKKELEIIHGPTKKKPEGIAIPVEAKPEESNDASDDVGLRNERFKQKYRIIIGNISKWLETENSQDKSTHKWMVYVRGPKENPNITHIVKKVRFFLHPSYRPNDIIDVEEYPFHLSRRGWGEFPLRVQIHFVNNINKPIDVIHNIKLDHTHSGLQTLGSETYVNVWLYKEPINNLKKIKQIKLNPTESTYESEDDSEMLDTECTMESIDAIAANIKEENMQQSIQESLQSSSLALQFLTSNKKPKETTFDKVPSKGNETISTTSNLNISLQMHDYCEPSECLSNTEANFDIFNSIFDISKIKLKSISTALVYFLRQLPLMSSRAADELFSSTFPFVAQSREEFLSWNKTKQFCAEWYRAKLIKSVLLHFNIPEIEQWSIRSILKFSRLTKFGVDVPENELEKTEKILSAPLQFNSHTKLPELERFLNTYCLDKRKDELSDDEEIDVININETEKKSIKEEVVDVTCENIIDFTDKDVTDLPNLHVKEMAAELGISLVPEKIVDNVWCCSAEMCITAATKYFVEDVLRRAVLNSNRFTKSSDINLEDVKVALLSREEFDVFFNIGLGKSA